MLLYHISQTLRPGDRMTPDYRRSRPLAAPFLEALERSEDCFYGMLLNGAYLYAVLEKSGLRQWADYVKWAAEACSSTFAKRSFRGHAAGWHAITFMQTLRTAGSCLKPPGARKVRKTGGAPFV